jgi:hypothetical protein
LIFELAFFDIAAPPHITPLMPLLAIDIIAAS